MDFNLPEELQMLQQTVRQFVDKELIPIEMQSKDGVELKPEVKERLSKKTREMGLWMLDVPEEYGGAAFARRDDLRPRGAADPLQPERRADRKSTRLNSSHASESRMPSSS